MNLFAWVLAGPHTRAQELRRQRAMLTLCFFAVGAATVHCSKDSASSGFGRAGTSGTSGAGGTINVGSHAVGTTFDHGVGTGPATGGPCSANLNTGDLACDTCATQSCCPQASACSDASQPCARYLKCLLDGGDPTVCDGQTGGAQAAAALGTCEANFCPAACHSAVTSSSGGHGGAGPGSGGAGGSLGTGGATAEGGGGPGGGAEGGAGGGAVSGAGGSPGTSGSGGVGGIGGGG